ncbi:MAG: DUF711 family protein [Acidilobaceae archaeon]
MVSRFSIRALTLHVSRDVLGDEDRFEGMISDLYSAKDAIEGEFDVRVDSLRFTLPDSESSVIDEVLDMVLRVKPDDILASIGNISSSSSRLVDIVSSVVRNELYVSVLLDEFSWSHARRLSEMLIRLADENPDYCTRVGINTLGSPIYTPYYPLSSSPGDSSSLTIALTYPNFLKEYYQSGGVESLKRGVLDAGGLAVKALSIASNILKVDFGGVDLSVSSWMEESTLGLVEAVAGTRMPRPGFTLGIRIINDVLDYASSAIKTIGFNEVQLPVAEDSRLKARVSEGEVTARDLARLSGVSLAGLDLVVVPASLDDVAGLILDVASYARTKKKPLGVRIIPVEGVEPGDKVLLSRFGETPVIPI